jgi:hypothetical protein
MIERMVTVSESQLNSSYLSTSSTMGIKWTLYLLQLGDSCSIGQGSSSDFLLNTGTRMLLNMPLTMLINDQSQ